MVVTADDARMLVKNYANKLRKKVDSAFERHMAEIYSQISSVADRGGSVLAYVVRTDQEYADKLAERINTELRQLGYTTVLGAVEKDYETEEESYIPIRICW